MHEYQFFAAWALLCRGAGSSPVPDRAKLVHLLLVDCSATIC